MKLFVAVTLLTLVATGSAAAERIWKVDQTVSFAKSGRMALHFKAGPLKFEEVVIHNMPTASDVAKSQKDPSDNSHPKIAVGISNDSGEDMKIRLTVTLEDKAGEVLMRCDRKDSVDGTATNDHTNLCWLDSVKTIDWPRLARVHLTATIEPD